VDRPRHPRLMLDTSQLGPARAEVAKSSS
jgi:hypothetical protein